MTDTIFAASSGQPPAGVAVIRVSGPAVPAALAALCGSLPRPRHATLRRVVDPAAGAAIDRALVLYFPGPHSFTGEDVAEFQLHGGRAVVAALLGALAAIPGLRLAQAGEFSRRAFEHGRIDLTAAEALADLIAADTEAQRRQALRQAEGSLARRYQDWRGRLIEAMALIEAELDFSDEDLPGGLLASARQGLAALGREIRDHLGDHGRGERLRDGVRIAVIGPPNAGKSSFINYLAKRDVAIVTDIPGTTRDVIEVHLDLGGFPVIVADTAGLRDGGDPVEQEGVARARRAAAAAEYRLLLYDATLGLPEGLAAEIGDAMIVANQIDRLADRSTLAPGHWPISARTGAGIAELLDDLTRKIAAEFSPGEAAPITRARHRALLEDALAALQRADAATDPVMVAEDARLAARSLGRITGAVDVEDVLDAIFSGFCIGK